MARNEIHVDAPPEAVWAVLADPPQYGEWVVGSKDIRRWDPEWPEPGAAFHHTFMIGPVPVKDSTSVLESDPRKRLKLRARARPTGVAHIVVELESEHEGTRVTLSEWPVEGPPAVLDNPVQDWLIRRRNDETLRRLKRLAERR